MKKKRIRHHVNPLNFRDDPEVPDWRAVFARPDQPLEVDVGSAKGVFLLGRAKQEPGINIVGLEIREPMVERVAARIAKAGLDNAHVLLCNANRSLSDLFTPGALERLYVHFPDPWFKKRHHKRRLIKPEFLIDIAKVLRIGGEFHFATDFAEYAEEVLAMMARDADFAEGVACAAPFGVETDREAWHRSQNDPVHRYVFKLERRIAKAEELALPEDWRGSGD